MTLMSLRGCLASCLFSISIFHSALADIANPTPAETQAAYDKVVEDLKRLDKSDPVSRLSVGAYSWTKIPKLHVVDPYSCIIEFTPKYGAEETVLLVASVDKSSITSEYVLGTLNSKYGEMLSTPALGGTLTVYGAYLVKFRYWEPVDGSTETFKGMLPASIKAATFTVGANVKNDAQQQAVTRFIHILQYTIKLCGGQEWPQSPF